MQYRTPGVYVEEIALFPPSVAQVETAIPAFIGYTAKADRNGTSLKGVPTRVTSLLEYESLYGGPQPEEKLEVAITETKDGNNTTSLTAKATFSVSDADSKPIRSKHNLYYALRLFFINGGGPCYIISVGPYLTTFGDPIPDDALLTGLAGLEKVDEPTLIVFPEGQSISTEAKYYSLQQAALAQCAKLKDRFSLIDVYDTVASFRGAGGIGISNLKYGAAYYPNVITTLSYVYKPSSVKLTYTVNGETKKIIEDTPDGNTETLETIATSNSAIYSKAKEAISQLVITLPPSSAVAGVYATVDSTRGVWKAPANISLNAVSGLTEQVTNDQQDSLNVDTEAGKSINALRAFAGKGILVWGARTLAGNDNEWRYVSVRRFFNMVEESVNKASAAFVFEPNDANTWVKIRAMIENYLTVLWRQGALAGAKPEQAFYVRVGLGQTMTSLDILEGRMIIEIGMAAVRPAEFIILRFSHKLQEA